MKNGPLKKTCSLQFYTSIFTSSFKANADVFPQFSKSPIHLQTSSQFFGVHFVLSGETDLLNSLSVYRILMRSSTDVPASKQKGVPFRSFLSSILCRFCSFICDRLLYMRFISRADMYACRCRLVVFVLWRTYLWREAKKMPEIVNLDKISGKLDRNVPIHGESRQNWN